MQFEYSVVVGDLHGKFALAAEILNKTKNSYNVIFLGDYVDSYNENVFDQVATLDLVCSHAAMEPDRVIALMGNHDWQYLDGLRCSGRTQYVAERLNQHKEFYKKYLKNYFRWNGWLFTHAGVAAQVLEKAFSSENPFDHIEDYLNSDRAKYAIGWYRGGRNEYGGIFWHDFDREFKPTFMGIPDDDPVKEKIHDFKQVCGHTRNPEVGAIRNVGNNYCIDTLEDDSPELLVIAKDSTAHTVSADEFLFVRRWLSD